ncbi:MAG: sensory rhodopsin transducer [Thiogranum sp.]|nr:sensory rhodopsin transducer [Thiogranum sp.]
MNPRRGSTGAVTGQSRNDDADNDRETIMQEIGARCWAIAEGYIPASSKGPEPQMTSHETACILNASTDEAQVEVMLYFTDRDPVGPYRVAIPAGRTRHIRFNELQDPEPVPRDTDYASVITANVPVVVQHTRLDSRQAELALISTMAYPVK